MTRRIEFLGVPGVGKSTACELLLRALRARSVRVQSLDQAALAVLLRARGFSALVPLARGVPRRLRLVALRLLDGSAHRRSHAFSAFRADYPEFIDYLFEQEDTRISLGRCDSQVVLLWLLRQMWWFQLAVDEVGECDCCVIEEGFASLGLSFLAYRDVPITDVWERAVRDYFRCMPAPDAVVVLRAPVEVAFGRMAVRKWGYPTRMRPLPVIERRAVLARSARSVEIGTAELRQRGVDVVEIENERETEDLRGAIEAVAPALVG